MIQFIIRRLLLSIVTLAIILVIVTLIPNVAPGDPARKIAGGTASPERLAAVTESLGLDKSVPEQLRDVAGDLIRFDFGEAFTKPGQSVTGLVRTSLWNSTKLVLFALVLVLPLSVAGGVWAAYRRDTWIDRLIVNVGVALSSLPEFVVGVLFLALLAVPIGFFKVVANPPEGANIFTQLQFLLLPALTVLTVYFGYIARITRASTISVLDSDYTRTAFMKGLATGEVFRRHTLRNSLLPTVAVVGTQLGYMFGGMVGLELIFNYPGLGKLIFDAVDSADYPLLRGGVLTVAVIYMIATLSADLLIAWMNPRARLNLGEG
ncbi:MAG: ABC transporter permease [Actinomycetota bacterium]